MINRHKETFRGDRNIYYLDHGEDYKHMPPRPLMFVFLVDKAFCHVVQAGVELLTSGDPPGWASQSGGITDVNHHV